MKSIVLFSSFLLMISCGKETAETTAVVQESTAAPYDTAAVDSFSVGATSVDVARRIRISSLNYQDSLRKISLKLEEEKLLNKTKEEKEKTEKKLAEEKKKVEAEKAKREKQKAQPENSTSETAVTP